MKALLLPNNRDVSYLNEILLDEQGLLRVLPYEQIAGIEHEDILFFCNKHAIYQIPTQELIDWLREQIGDRSAIEIGSGHGAIGRALDIPRTDSFMQIDAFNGVPSDLMSRQQQQMMTSYFSLLRQPPTDPPEDVEKLNAAEAVEKYNPQVVIGAFITHRWKPGMSGGNEFGVEEEDILAAAETYIHIGNKSTHYQKPLLDSPHTMYQFPWLVSRAFNRTENAIWVWHHV